MEWFLIALCALCGVGCLLALLRASLKQEGAQATILIVVGSSLAVATTVLFVYIAKGLMHLP